MRERTIRIRERTKGEKRFDEITFELDEFPWTCGYLEELMDLQDDGSIGANTRDTLGSDSDAFRDLQTNVTALIRETGLSVKELREWAKEESARRLFEGAMDYLSEMRHLSDIRHEY